MHFNNKIEQSDILEFIAHLSALAALSIWVPTDTLEIFFYGLILPDFLWFGFFFGLIQDDKARVLKGLMHKIALLASVFFLVFLKIDIFIAVASHLLIDYYGGSGKNGRN
jgi:hypothetical protein